VAPPSSRYFHTVTHYSDVFIQNQPPFLKNFSVPEGISFRLRIPEALPKNLSRPDFLHNFFPVVKITTPEKVSNWSNSVCFFMLIKSECSQHPGAVENPCGKTCGKCGKLMVINRYSVLFPPSRPLWKSVYKRLHNAGFPLLRTCYVTARRKILPDEMA